jgi:hypothetical protein
VTALLIAVGGTIVAAWFPGLSNLAVSPVGVIQQGLASLTRPDYADRLDHAGRARPNVYRASTWAKSMRLGADIWLDLVRMA